MKLHNTLTKAKQEFTPLTEGKVSMYVCGPTVYDRPHIGNARSVVVYDTLFRVLNYMYGKDNVTYIRNITDVDDKINARAIELGISIQELTSKTYKEFQEDMLSLNCLSPTHEPKATMHIQDIITINEKLIENGHAYVSDNHVYFDVTSAKEYGCLSGRELDEMIAGARVEVSESKKHPGDFVLWKPASSKDDASSVFESPWGEGRPGWHIECSAMSMHFLGTDFDIHGGGADLIFPHHTNEIAQSSCAFPGSKFARYWVHNGFLTVNGEKMSKSLGNFLTVYDLAQKGLKGEVIRYLLLGTHYRKPLDFNDKAMYDAKESLDYLYRALANIFNDNSQKHMEIPAAFRAYLEDDLNIAGALAFMHDLAKQINKSEAKEEIALQLLACGNLIGLLYEKDWFGVSDDVDVEYIETLITQRLEAKKSREFQVADTIRLKLKEMNIEIEDRPDGTSKWQKI